MKVMTALNCEATDGVVCHAMPAGDADWQSDLAKIQSCSDRAEGMWKAAVKKYCSRMRRQMSLLARSYSVLPFVCQAGLKE